MVRRFRRYSPEFKSRVVEVFMNRGSRSVESVAHELGVHSSRMYEWCRAAEDAGSFPIVSTSDSQDQGPRAWPPEKKLDVVMRSLALTQEQLGDFLRKEGVHEAMLLEWKQDMLSALSREQRAPARADQKRIQDLERELRLKDKALADASTLLVIQKKAQAIWGDPDAGNATAPSNAPKR